VTNYRHVLVYPVHLPNLNNRFSLTHGIIQKYIKIKTKTIYTTCIEYDLAKPTFQMSQLTRVNAVA
jgi:hypothetical protein